ncbi:hypothetical protein [Streptomyces sp. NPDC053720]|uniref:hypothetical protein n=1 Tax=Streptomyces sp. NPDC053720 TaxID=3154855 RepID=UPI003415A8DE
MGDTDTTRPVRRRAAAGHPHRAAHPHDRLHPAVHALKAAWVSGSHVGIPDDSPPLDDRTTMIVTNAITILPDSAAVLLTLLLTQAWGRRVPARLLVPPMWAASGLLLPLAGTIMALPFSRSMRESPRRCCG